MFMKEEKDWSLEATSGDQSSSRVVEMEGKEDHLNHTLFQNVITTFKTLYSNLKIDN